MQFQELKSKRILVYGTGNIAKKMLEVLKTFHVVGIIDRIYLEGELNGIPILTWDDIDRDMADVIIIASMEKYYKTIFKRIQYYCATLDIMVYGGNGQNLTEEYRLKDIDRERVEYFHKSTNNLRKKIDCYDAISFGLYDTLIMRKILEPEDIFGIVEDRIRDKGIVIPDFKKIRRTAEIQSNGADIYQIYRIIKHLLQISDEECATLLQAEIECEKQCLVPRQAMVEVLEYAVKKGKQVSIIVDTYFPTAMIEDFLGQAGIIGYDKLYLSCENGLEKANGLYECYKCDLAGAKCLHIGSDPYSDEEVPRRYGIDSYGIRSAYEMLKMSSLRKLLLCSCGVDNRVVLGLILAKVFNNPFALNNTSGFTPIKSFDQFACLFIVPIILIYIQNLMKVIRERGSEVILFASRDGYLFKEIYDYIFEKETAVPCVYFLTSRKLCLTSALDCEQDFVDLGNWLSDEKKLRGFLGELFEKELMLQEDMDTMDIKKTILYYRDKLQRYSEMMKKNYLKYIRDTIPKNKKYLFCELNSSGTVHNALNKILKADLDGFYLYKKESPVKREINVISVYDKSHGFYMERMRDLLEIVFTSYEPSVCAMDENGKPVYSSEHRTKGEIRMLKRIHTAVVEAVQQYVELRGFDKMIDTKLPDVTLGLCGYVHYMGEVKSFINQGNVDDMNQNYICIWDTMRS